MGINNNREPARMPQLTIPHLLAVVSPRPRVDEHRRVQSLGIGGLQCMATEELKQPGKRRVWPLFSPRFRSSCRYKALVVASSAQG